MQNTRQHSKPQPKTDSRKSSGKKVIRCSLDVRELPLECFRMERDKRKWKRAARSRYELLLKLSTYANPDGTFASEDGKKNFSPSAEKLQRHYAERTLYRLTNDLKELGLLSWKREKKYRARRTYRIHLQPEEHLPHSKDTPAIFRDTPAMVAGESPAMDAGCDYLSHSPESKQNTGLEDSSSTTLRLLESLPSSAPSVLEKEKGSGVAFRSSENGNSNPVNPPSQKQNQKQKLLLVDSWGTRLADQGDDDE